jgi:hypothetical protein
MKSTFFLSTLGIVFVLAFAQAENTRLGVKSKGEHEHMFVSADGPKEWYSALELERIARGYAESKKADFSFEGAELNIWVKTDGGEVLADVYWSRGIGKPVLHVEIGRDGKPTRYDIKTATG